MNDPTRLTPADFCRFLDDNGISRFFLVSDAESGVMKSSHPILEPLARTLAADCRDYDAHEAVFVQRGALTGVLQGAFVHRTRRGQAAGGVRYWHYPTVEAFLRDGLRLALGMTLKNALAGLWWGGGKGVMVRGTGVDPSDPDLRRAVYEEYGQMITELRGCYVTAEDVGTTPSDMASVFARTRFTTCIPPDVGGSGNPSGITALGVARGIEAALDHLGLGSVEGKTIFIQGLGQVGRFLACELARLGAGRIMASDVDLSSIEELKRIDPSVMVEFRPARERLAEDLAEPCDVLAPCATGGMLGPQTIPSITARVVCGAANNQLEDPQRDDRSLDERGVLYVPDFLVNRMGIVQCADEQYGVLDDDPRVTRHLGREWENSIYNLTRTVLEQAAASGKTPHRIALEMAARRSMELHPLWGHRGQVIIDSLVAGGWSRG